MINNSFSSVIKKSNEAVTAGTKASKTLQGYYNLAEGLEGFYKIQDKKTNFEDYSDLTGQAKKDYDKSKIKPFAFPEWTKSIPKVGYIIGIIDFLSGADKKASSPKPISMEAKLNFSITGHHQTDGPFSGVDFFTPGSDWAGHTTNEPIYNNVLGTFAVLETPKVRVKKYSYKWTTYPLDDAGYGRLLISLDEPVNFAINPHSGLRLADISARFVFELDFIPGIDLTSPYTSELTEVSTGENEDNKHYISPFIPLSCFEDYNLKADLLRNPWIGGEYYSIKYIKIQFLLNLEKDLHDPFYSTDENNGVTLMVSHSTVWDESHVTESFPNEAWPPYEGAFFLSDMDFDKTVDNLSLTQDETIYAWSTIEVGENIQTNGHQLTLVAGNEIIVHPADLPQNTDLLIGLPPECETVPPPVDLEEIKKFCDSGQYDPSTSGNLDDDEDDFAFFYSEEDDLFDFTVSPNPVTDVLKVQYTFEEESTFQLSVQNSVGSNIYTYQGEQAFQGFYQQEIDFSDFPSGMYVVSIVTPKGRKSVKVIK